MFLLKKNTIHPDSRTVTRCIKDKTLLFTNIYKADSRSYHAVVFPATLFQQGSIEDFESKVLRQIYKAHPSTKC